MKESTENTVVAEKPKTTKHKEGNAAAGASPVEGATKTKTPRVPKNSKYRILNGVDAAKFRGQRQIVVKALQSLGEGFHSVDAIAAKCDGLVSKADVAASAAWHLKGLAANLEVEVEAPPAPVKAEKTAEAVAA